MTPSATLSFQGLESFARFEHAAMATSFVFHLRSADDDADALHRAAGEAFRLIDRIEDQLSFYRETSEVTRINRALPGESFRVSEATVTCLLTALEVAAVSGGAFDPFSGSAALVAKGQPVPGHLIDRSGDDPPGAACLAIDPVSSTVTKLDGRRWLDLGAVGKGYALDAAADLLSEWGVAAGLLVAGGSSVVAFGAGPGVGGAWILLTGRSSAVGELPLTAPFGLAASGEGFQPGHIVRPTSAGRPVSAPRRAYAIASSGALADALSTALFLVAPEQREALEAPWPDARLWVELARQPEPQLSQTGLPAPSEHLVTHFVRSGPPGEREAPAPGESAFAPPSGSPHCHLVIPCWRESRRLPAFLPALCEAVTASRLPVSVQVVDDGSTPSEADATAKIVERWRGQHACLQPMLRLVPHGGKGAAIAHGWQHAPAEATWVGFVDADGSVPGNDVVRLVTAAFARPSPDRVFAPTRRHRDPSYPVRRYKRRALVGALFAWWSRARLDHGATDPQCGCKLLPMSLARGTRWTERGYGLDLELLLAARRAGLPVENVPIAWEERSGSRLRPQDLLALLQSVERLRLQPRRPQNTRASPM